MPEETPTAVTPAASTTTPPAVAPTQPPASPQVRVETKEVIKEVPFTPPAVLDRLLRSEVKAAATKAGITDPSLLDHLPLPGASVDANGVVTGVDAAVAAMKASHPSLFVADKPAPTSVAAAGTAPSTTAEPPPVASVLGLSNADYAKAKQAERERLRRQG